MLPERARIAVVSPSGVSQAARLDAGIALLAEWGYEPELLPHARAQHRYLAGADDDRLADLELAFSGDFDAVWMARGGYGLARLLPQLELNRLAPVPFLGFSDGTILLNQLALSGRPAVHAPVVHALASHNDEASRVHLRALLHDASPLVMEGRALVAGGAEGILLGGNLCMIATACGTPSQLDFRDAIVLLEEVGEAPYKVDRLLVQCRDAGIFAGARGFVLGEFLNAPAPEGADWAVEDVVVDILGPLDVPILAGLPVGHGPANHALPLGRPATLRARRLVVHP
jgi:muramoyltetrapeptide carboxypeptidase